MNFLKQGLIIFSMVSLLGCVDVTGNNVHQGAMCQEIKRRIIFTGATSDQVKATQQRAESQTLHQSYRQSGC